jgi:polysaccharide biosynthesis protein PslH
MNVVFLLSKAPYGRHQDGDTQVSRLLLEAAAQSYSVSGLALADVPTSSGAIEVSEVPKPRLRIVPTAMRSVGRRRSMIHTRFAPESLVRAVAEVDADLLVARRLYMSQAVLDSGRASTANDLVAFADVLESDVLRQRQSLARPLLRLEARRTRRDELRCARAALRVATFSETERAALASEVADSPKRIDLVFPAAKNRADLSNPAALFIGDMHWAPNREAAGRVEHLWPAIRAAVPSARLLMVGRGTDSRRSGVGVERLGFVEDIEAVWARTSLLLAPVPIGGGVRVKILDAARRGVPVVASPAAVGSTDEYLPVRASRDDSSFVETASRLLAHRASRQVEGAELYETSRELARNGFVERQLEELLRPN